MDEVSAGGQSDHPKRCRALSRREFLISLGAGTGASIAGYFLLHNGWANPAFASAPVSSQSVCPRLREDLVFCIEEGLVTLHAAGQNGLPTCAVNDIGGEVLRRLDGRHTITQIGQEIAAAWRLQPSEALDARLAFFVTQVGMLGFLREPFYACILEGMAV